MLSTCVFSVFATSYEQLRKGGNWELQPPAPAEGLPLLHTPNSLGILGFSPTPYFQPFLSRRCLPSLVITDVRRPGPLTLILEKETVELQKGSQLWLTSALTNLPLDSGPWSVYSTFPSPSSPHPLPSSTCHPQAPRSASHLLRLWLSYRPLPSPAIWSTPHHKSLSSDSP